MEGPNRGEDTLLEFYNSDALWRYTMGVAADLWEQLAQIIQCQGQDHVEGNAQIHCLLMMGVSLGARVSAPTWNIVNTL